MAEPTPLAPLRPRSARTPSRQLSEALVDAAEVVLRHDGVAAVTVRAVAAQASVAPMGVYNHLGGKEGLIEALLVRGFMGLRAAVTVTGDADPLERLRNAGLRYRGFALTNPQHYALMFGGSSRDRPTAGQVLAAAEDAFGELVSHLQAAMDVGCLPAGDPYQAAQHVWSSVHGAVSLELGGLLSGDVEAAYGRLLDLLIRGLSTGPPPQ